MSDPHSFPISSEGRLSASLTDEEFVEHCYRRFLGRPADKPGREASLCALQKGLPRLDFVESLVASPEYYSVLTKSIFGASVLPNLRELKPGNFQDVSFSGAVERITTFTATQPSDFDWLETMILEHGYYERPGVWSLAIDPDKRIIAELISRFAGEKILEIGCATGPVLQVLREMGIRAEGIEISHMAHASAYPQIKKEIHFGDILNLSLRPEYRLIVGMDVFEHLNPNKMKRSFSAVTTCSRMADFFFTNIPAFGNDFVFGEVFPIFLPDPKATDSFRGRLGVIFNAAC